MKGKEREMDRKSGEKTKTSVLDHFLDWRIVSTRQKTTALLDSCDLSIRVRRIETLTTPTRRN